MDKLRKLIRYYIRQYGLTQRQAIESIKADLKDIEQNSAQNT